MRPPPSFPFTIYLLIAILLAMTPVVCLISAVDYTEGRGQLDANAEAFQNQTETGILLSMRLVDAGLKLFDDTLDRRMEEGFGPVLAEYERAGRDPAAMNLSRVQQELGEEFEIYIINDSGVIEYTTYPPDLGLDFRETPYFYDRIAEIRTGDMFTADRVVMEHSTGELRKYAYMPSPDHRYLFELGLAASEFKQSRAGLNYQAAAEELVALNPNIEDLTVFNCLCVPITNETYPDDACRLSFVQEAYRERTTLEVENATAGEQTRYLFIDMADPRHASDMSLVAVLTYNTRAAEEKLADVIVQHFRVLFAVFVLIGCLSVFGVYCLTRPIRTLVEDVETIARGDLGHPIRMSRIEEFAHLERSISAMVASLEGTMQKLRESEETATRYGHTLEEQVREQTADLAESNRMANLYLDVMGHDINNANNVANLYSDLLLADLEGEPEAEYARKAKMGLTRSIEIIRSVNTIRDIQERTPAFRVMDLDRAIRHEIEHFPGLGIAYAGTGVTVFADDLLPEVFANLLGNAVKFGGPDAEITVRVEERGEEVVVSVEDTGPGIPDTVKTHLFNRMVRGGHRAAGTGLGLYICRMLVERYGGRIWADDRVPEKPECGAAIRFTLRKAGSGSGP